MDWIKQLIAALPTLGLGIPQGEIRNSAGDVVFPTNALEHGLQGSDNAAKSYAAAFMGPGARGAYRGVPDQLMGFNRIGPPKPFAAEKYTYELPVRVQLSPEFGGEAFYDTIKGLNKSHALERAYRNWPTAQYIIPADQLNPFPGHPEVLGLPK